MMIISSADAKLDAQRGIEPISLACEAWGQGAQVPCGGLQGGKAPLDLNIIWPRVEALPPKTSQAGPAREHAPKRPTAPPKGVATNILVEGPRWGALG